MARERVTVSIRGMTCAGCVARIEEELRRQEGVIWASINFAAGQATVTYDPGAFAFCRLTQVISGLGYELADDACPRADGAPAAPGLLRAAWRPALVLFLAALLLAVLYLGGLALAQGGWQNVAGLLQ